MDATGTSALRAQGPLQWQSKVSTEDRWTFTPKDAQDHEKHEVIEVSLGSIIAVTQLLAESQGDFSLLYAVKNPEAKEGAKESPFVVRSFDVTGVPSESAQRFLPYERNHWLPRQHDPSSHVERHVIVSTGSGTGLAKPIWEQLVKPLLDYLGLKENEDYHLHFTTSETTVTELTQNVILQKTNDGVEQAILLLSGDGGILDIVNTLLHGYRPDNFKNPTITLLPLGTGNATANSSKITSDETFGLSSMLRGSPKELPLFRATFSPGAKLLVNQGQEERPLQGSFEDKPAAYGAVVCSWGLHATLVADSDTAEYRKFGAERFKMAAKESLFPSDGSLPHAYKGRVSIRRGKTADWETIPRNEHGYILATPVSQLEAGFTISPSSKPLDGKLHLVHFGHLSGQDAMEIMGKAYDGGKHVEDDKVGYEEIEGLKIEFHEDDAQWRRVCLDGKVIRIEMGGWVEVHGDTGGVVDLVSKN